MQLEKIQKLAREASEAGMHMPASDTALVARQPIFDLRGNIWAYELLFRDPMFQKGLGSQHAATSSVIIDGVDMLRSSLRDKQRFFINFTGELLEAEVARLLPPEICTIEILETVAPTPDVLTGLKHLKEAGYIIALDDYVGQPELEPFLPLADIIKVEVLGRTSEQLENITHMLQPLHKVLLAEKVEDHEQVELCKDLGFLLFQGFFYSKGEVVRGKKMSPAQVTKARLLALSSEGREDVIAIAESISADVLLTYKLLRYVNSVYFGLAVKVNSVLHAVKLLGTIRTLQWVYVSTLASMDTTPLAKEVVSLAALRAKFLELLAKERFVGAHGEVANKFFLLGLFSLLETIMQVPFEEIANSISMDENISLALMHKEGPMSAWLTLVTNYEKANWGEVFYLAATLELSPATLVAKYAEANQWVTMLFGTEH